MKVLNNICVLLLVVVTFAIVADVAHAKSNNILTLDSSNFKTICAKYSRILALFTAPKCEACTKFGPQFADLSKDFEASKDELVFASITCNKEEELCKKFNIATLPTLIVMDQCEQGIRYRGKHNSVAVAEFIRKYLVSPAITLQGKDELDIFKKDLSRLGVVGYFESKEDPRYEPFLQASRLHMNQYPYGVVINADPEEYGIHDIPAIVMYKQGKEYHYRIPQDVTGNSIVEWVNENSLLFMDTIPLNEIEELIRTSFASVGVFWLPENYPQSDLAQFDVLKEAFPTYFFVKVYVKLSDNETVKRIVSSAVDLEQQLPAFTFIHLTTEIYPLEEGDDFIPAHIRELLNGFTEGTARLVQKSAPLPDPEIEKTKTIKTLVFDNFYETVDQFQHDTVILMVSKRHCLKCEEILSTLKELAEIIRQKHSEDDIVFGEYDIDDNFVPELLTDVPTLFYFKAGQKNAPRSISRNVDKISVLFNLIKNSASFDFDVELPNTVEDHVEADDISPQNMGVAQEQPDPKEFLGDVESGTEEPAAPWMNNPVVVSNVDDNSLQKFIDENERVLLVFVEHANAQADLLEQIGILSQQYGDRIAFGKVEAKNAPQMIAFFTIKNFPAIKYFSLHEAVDMRELDAFTLPSLEIFLWRHLDDFGHKFETANELEDYVTNEEGKTFWTPKLIVLGGVFTTDNIKNPAFRSFMKTSEHLLSSVQSGYVVFDNIGLPEEYGLESVPSLMLYSKGKRVAVLPMKDDVHVPISELSQWVLDNGVPTVTEFSPFLYTNLYWNLKPLVVLFVDQSKTADATEQIKMLEEVCNEFKGKVHCNYANGSDPQLVGSHMLQWDLNPEKLPTVVIDTWPVRDESEYYPMRVEVTKESLRDHINKVLNKEIKPHVRSEPVVPFAPLPEIAKVVRNSLDDFINQPDKEVLLYFTHSDERGCPSCPRVDKAAQKWAKKFAKYSNVALGQFDVYRNDVPFSVWREINEIPAMLYYRSTNKQEPLKYIKSLEFKDLKDFLVKNGATLQKAKSD